MKPTKYIAFILSIICVIPLLFSCKNGSKNTSSGTVENGKDIFNNQQDGYLIEQLDNGKLTFTPFSKMQEQPLDTFLFSTPSKFKSRYMSSVTCVSLGGDSIFGTEYIEKIDDNHVVAVTKLSGKIKEPVYAYCVFSKVVHEDTGNENKTESWETTIGEYYFTNETLNKSTFNSVKPGDSLADLEKLNPIFNIGIYNLSGGVVESQSIMKWIYYIIPEGTVEMQIVSDDNYSKAESNQEAKYFHIKEVTFTPFGTPNSDNQLVLTALMDHAPLLPSAEKTGTQK